MFSTLDASSFMVFVNFFLSTTPGSLFEGGRSYGGSFFTTVISCRMGASHILNEFMRLLFHSEQPQNSTILGGPSHFYVNHDRTIDRSMSSAALLRVPCSTFSARNRCLRRAAVESAEVVVTPHEAGGMPQGSLAHVAENYSDCATDSRSSISPILRVGIECRATI